MSVRTVYRDIDALVRTGAPIRGEAGVGYALAPGYHLPPVNLTAEEAEALGSCPWEWCSSTGAEPLVKRAFHMAP